MSEMWPSEPKYIASVVWNRMVLARMWLMWPRFLRDTGETNVKSTHNQFGKCSLDREYIQAGINLVGQGPLFNPDP